MWRSLLLRQWLLDHHPPRFIPVGLLQTGLGRRRQTGPGRDGSLRRLVPDRLVKRCQGKGLHRGLHLHGEVHRRHQLLPGKITRHPTGTQRRRTGNPIQTTIPRIPERITPAPTQDGAGDTGVRDGEVGDAGVPGGGVRGSRLVSDMALSVLTWIRRPAPYMGASRRRPDGRCC